MSAVVTGLWLSVVGSYYLDGSVYEAYFFACGGTFVYISYLVFFRR